MATAIGSAIFALGLVAGATRSMRLFVGFLAAGALFVPLREGLVVAWAGCDMGVAPSQLAMAALNGPHVFLFGVLTAIALRVRRPSGARLPTGAVGLLVVGFGLMLELEQGLFATGHCRLRDLLPDVFGLAIVYAVFMAMERRRRPA